MGNNSCVACPAHTDTLGPGADSLDACLCVPGYVASDEGSDEASEEACAACPRNSFNGDLGDAVCWPCPPHSGTDGPASTLVDCQCHAGYTPAVADGACAACAAGEYKASAGMGLCTSCPAHMASAPGATALANCTCNAGFEKRAPGACEACEANAYCPGADAKLACPGNSTSSAGTAALAACTCLPGFFRYGDACVECSENYYCANNTRSACPANSSSAVLSVSIDNCTCVPGFRGT